MKNSIYSTERILKVLVADWIKSEERKQAYEKVDGRVGDGGQEVTLKYQKCKQSLLFPDPRGTSNMANIYRTGLNCGKLKIGYGY